MNNNFFICQLSDIHFTDDFDKLFNQINTAEQFKKAVNFCNNLNPQPDLYIISGDLIHDKSEYYKNFINITNLLQKPYYLMMGNHDVRDQLRKFISDKSLIDSNGYINFSLNNHPIRIICLDTAVENMVEGEISIETMKWLKDELSKDLNKTTIIFMHHPPINIGSQLFDDIKCKNGNEFLQFTKEYQNISKIVFGHVHCKFSKNVENQELLSCPSSSFQIPIDAKSPENLLMDNSSYIQLFKWDKDLNLDIHTININ